ncbi:MAG: DUF6443 domain-containing protein [Ginsengibacter sp.]
MFPYLQLCKKFALTLTILLILVIEGIAQIKPGTATSVAVKTGNTAPNLPSANSSTDVNCIYAWQPLKQFTDESLVTRADRLVTEVNMSVQYIDGLGRPIQTVGWQASPGKKDIVAPIVYDVFGREQYKYLPYEATTNNGSLKINPFADQNTFYSNAAFFPAEQPSLAGEQFFYSHTQFESSPLNRPVKSFAPGNSWAGSEGGTAEKGINMQYMVNISTDQVRIWRIGFNSVVADINNIPYSGSTDKYSAGELYKNVSIDEAGNATVEYKDKEGHVVLKKVQIGSIATDFSGYGGFLCTYYIYDDMGQLRTVVPPKAVAAMATPGNWVLDQTTVNELCFRYEYDERQRMIAKKVPGAGWVYMVYDNRDRLVFVQDANMRSKSPQQWMYTLYDDINRPIQTGIMGYIYSWATLRSSMPATTQPLTASGTNVSTNPADMYINDRDYGRILYEATNSITFDNGFISEDNADFTAQIIIEAASTFSTNVSVNTNPIPISGVTLYPLTYTYYDDYAATTKTYSSVNNSKLDNGGNTYAEALPAQKSTQTKGMVTITKVRVIEDPNNLSLGKWLEAVNFYDDKGRVIQAQSTNYKGGNDIITNRYDFTGKVVSNYMAHYNVSGNVSNLRVLTSMNYDHAGRLKTITKTINDDAINNKRVIVTNTYDAMGQLKNKKTGQKSATDVTALEDDNYNYNIRGWLKNINWYSGSGTYASQMNSTSNKWFSMDLSYDWGFDNNASQYNGNISGTRWKTAGDGQERAYGFKYDAANRLLKGDFTQNNSGWATDPVIDFSMKMGDGITAASAYDENGNIIKMWQKGILGVQNSIIDDLTYSYYTTSNKLSKVADIAPTIDTKLGDFTDNNITNDYGYDVNGNLITDLNKRLNGNTGIDQTTGGAITYNFLNLPWQINIKNTDGSIKGTITYIYDAAGNKLEKRTSELASSYNNNTAKQNNTNYLGGFVYENNVLKFFGHEEGRIRYEQATNVTCTPLPNRFIYDYFIKDHLGNVRMVLTEQNEPACYPAATMETTASATEELLYANLPQTRSDLPAGYPVITGNAKVAKVSAAAGSYKVGPSITLKVMAGDKFNLSVNSWWKSAAAPGSPVNPLNEIIAALAGSAAGVSNSKITSAQITNSGVLTPNVTSFLTTQTTGTAKPKAYINWVLFDEQFKYVNSNSNFEQVDVSDVYKTHTRTNLPVSKTGYLYIYVSNETPNIDVFFDNLQVTHIPGPMLEETHYYPFGLTMAGISSKAAGSLVNRKKYNGIEYDDDLDLDIYEAYFRNLDPQTGRWWQIDPKIEYDQESTSPYASMANDPILKSDPLGDIAEESQESSEASESSCCGGAALAKAGRTWSTTQKLAGAAEVIGGGPEDPVADVVAGVIEVVGGAKALWELLTTPEQATVPPKPTAPAAPSMPTQTTTTPTAPPAASQAQTTSNSRAGKAFTPKEKAKVIEANKANNNGAAVCQNCGVTTTKPAQSKKNETPPKTDRQVDHKYPKSKGGSGTADNGQVLCRDCNVKKSDKVQ